MRAPQPHTPLPLPTLLRALPPLPVPLQLQALLLRAPLLTEPVTHPSGELMSAVRRRQAATHCRPTSSRPGDIRLPCHLERLIGSHLPGSETADPERA
jgi:hypothetical protein